MLIFGFGTLQLLSSWQCSLWHLLLNPPEDLWSVSWVYMPTVRASPPQDHNFWFIWGFRKFHESWNQTHVCWWAGAHVNTQQRNAIQRRTHTILRVTGVTEPGKLTGLLTQVGRRHPYHRQEVVGRQKQDEGMQEQDGREVRACTYVSATWDAREHIWSRQCT